MSKYKQEVIFYWATWDFISSSQFCKKKVKLSKVKKFAQVHTTSKGQVCCWQSPNSTRYCKVRSWEVMRKKEKPVCLLLHSALILSWDTANMSFTSWLPERLREEGEGNSFFLILLFPPSTWFSSSTQAEEVASRFQLPSMLPEPAPWPPFRPGGACTPRSEFQLLKTYALSSWGASSISGALSCLHRGTPSPSL